MDFLRIAHTKGMLAPEYVFIGNGNLPVEQIFKPWTTLGDLSSAQVENWKRLLVEINFKQVCYVSNFKLPMTMIIL